MTTPVRQPSATGPHTQRTARLTSIAQRTLLALAAITLFAEGALAQQTQAAAEPDYATQQPAPQGAQNVDPPGRVARLNYMAGTVTTEPAGASDWSYAQLNRPLTTGDQLWDDKDARSEMHIGSTAVRLGASTSLDVLNLDDTNAQLKVVQGTLSTHVREVPQGGSYEIDTPNLALGVTGPGDYRVDVAPDGSSTTVTVRSGNATVYGDNGQVPVAAGQQVRFAGTALQQVADNGAPQPDSFDTWTEGRDAAEDRSVSARYVSRDVPGYQDLDANGSWRNDPQYGEVWTPNAVPAGWAPYHDGHWIWQAPWGWTWVDDQPWGFAPYHYGRWAYVDDSWAWVPGPVVEDAPPVYAPALVGFVGGGDSQFSWGVNLAIGGAMAAGVAWFPLGPGEPWHPHWGDWSPRYYQRVNETVVVNNYNHVTINNIHNVHNTFVNYHAPGAITAVPATAFVHGQPTGRFAQKVDPRQWHNAQVQSGAPNLAPVKQSFGPGMRNATYRPPADVGTRSVVATRGAAVPAAFHDNLAQRFAQGGGRVPGAGDPIVRTSVPAHFAGIQQPGRAAGMPTQNVRVVQSHVAGGAPGLMTGGPVQHGAGAQPGGRPGAMPQGQAGFAANGHPMPGGAPANAMQAQMRHGAPAGGEAQRPGAPGNGVPRPPQFAGHPGTPGHAGTPAQAGMMQQNRAAAEAQHGQPSWTQPHQPMAQQRSPNEAMGGAQAQEQAHRPENAAVAQMPHAPSTGAPRVEQAPGVHQAQPAQQFARGPQGGEPQAPHAPMQMQAQAPHVQQPMQQPRPQPVRAEPQHAPEQFHAQAPQQPRAEFHPQPQPQPRAEFHPQPQPQPRPQPQQVREQPRPQPQPQHEQPHQQANENHGRDKPHG
ncbi:DUF6600 domain-containing protein [Paraburkholderia phosphatilytica]|uniref:DUF6600 domain-containing protein n=1 Tax=Paraburkholderia phosphatilytica TaxID=2282883 RepID=UPI001F0B795D|nr:DUF6600 domain-containing protein [Paraburkholderia phosphatilytica]